MIFPKCRRLSVLNKLGEGEGMLARVRVRLFQWRHVVRANQWCEICQVVTPMSIPLIGYPYCDCNELAFIRRRKKWRVAS